jgi:PIN domain nuclease of toxin-antitoxin system
MRLLLDTHVVLWWLGGVPRLGERAQTDIAGADEVLVSAVSCYEIAFKQNLGKLQATDELDRYLEADGFLALPVTLKHAVSAGRLPLHNRDPFDRLLVAQARCEGLTLVTADGRLRAYDVPILDAAG